MTYNEHFFFCGKDARALIYLEGAIQILENWAKIEERDIWMGRVGAIKRQWRWKEIVAIVSKSCQVFSKRKIIEIFWTIWSYFPTFCESANKSLEMQKLSELSEAMDIVEFW